jgi:hypothetical protein
MTGHERLESGGFASKVKALQVKAWESEGLGK